MKSAWILATAVTLLGDRGAVTMKAKSSAFDHNGSIPSKYTCEGNDVSPPLSWSDAPKGTKSFALIVDDPDAPDPSAPKRTWVHWVVFDIPATTTELAEGAASKLPNGAKTGVNDWKKASYGGPCPPIGRHRYFHKVYALDTTLALDQPTKADLEKAMQGHVLAQAELIGTYEKKKK
jgi:Raf kinase inhibitor-like YbhB/YbcL family protein